MLHNLTYDSVPLVVDLDGTLIKTDLLWEGLVRYLSINPLGFLNVICWLFRGRQYLKHELADRVKIDPAALPYTDQLVDQLRTEHSAGRKIVLATASDEKVAGQVASYLGIFSEVIASDPRRNLKSRNKANALQQRFGTKGFDYAGNSRADVTVWSSARKAIMVNASSRLTRSVTEDMEVTIISTRRFSLRTWARAIRVQQWAKNLIVFVPVITSHQIGNVSVVLNALLGMILFSLAASAVYLVNDVLDLDADRQHPVKRYRPLASGELPIRMTLSASLILFTTATLGATFLPVSFLFVLSMYLAITTLYSTFLKKKLMADVVCLALLYTLRVVAGCVATDIQYSSWLLAFALFMFFSLALLKRFSELILARADGREHSKARGYIQGDLEAVGMLGISSGSLAALVMVLYVTSDQVRILYHRPEILLLIAPVLLYWLGRIWLLAYRGNRLEDPVLYALRDKASYIAGSLCLAIVALASI
jgi:4-hydroxybenzoate polyprenyltransferase